MPKDVAKRVYNLQSKQIVKLFSRIFNFNHAKMLNDFVSSGDVSETVGDFFEKSRTFMTASTLTLQEIDEFLESLSKQTLEVKQVEHFEAICKKCTVDDLKMLIRLIKHDLKMNCGARHVLDALHPDAYEQYQKSRDLKIILNQFGTKTGHSHGISKRSSLQLSTAISPMLAEACKDFEKAIKKYPEGFYCEIKYDGERVQIHKKGDEFKFFSRNLKSVQDHKTSQVRDFLPKAFPQGKDMILDSEILMVDTVTGDPLPFGTLGKHKKEKHSSAVTCLFIFDCLYFNGEDLTRKTLQERRKFLEDNFTEVKNRIQLSETKILKTKNELIHMTKTVLKKGLEGLVLKGLNTVYEPGKRHWLKVKKDYLFEGGMADTADLVVLGAWFGTGKMGGQYSIFLMGCYDGQRNDWRTVTKCHSGLSDIEMDRMHKKISPLMEKQGPNKSLPKWIKIYSSQYYPDALAKDPLQMPVFEITGAEFTESPSHSANSISIRFPRITKVRTDKSPFQATTLEELTQLFKESKAGVKLDKLKDSQESKAQMSDLKMQLEMKPSKTESSEDDEVPVKKFKLNDLVKLEATSDCSALNSCSPGLFNGYLMYPSVNLKEHYNEEITNFQKFGGKCVDNSLSANLVLHEYREIKGNAASLRKYYSPECSHLQIQWLCDSLKENQLKTPLKYFVKLHQV